MATQLAPPDTAFRAVTADEVAHYQQHGWVKLDAFIPRDTCDALLALAKEKMGESGDRNLPPESFSYFNPLTMRGINHPLLRPVIDQCGRGARRLIDRRADVGIRYFTDNFAVKLPVRTKQDGKGGAGISDWHQDYAASGSDRSGGMVFWLAMEDFTPAKGTMAFLNGSNRHGVMGHYATYGEGNLLSAYPELPDLYESSGNLTYTAGDVTVHNNLTVHSAGDNTTDGPRWTYIVIVNPADACWTGGPADAFKSDGLTLHRTMPDDRFPVIG